MEIRLFPNQSENVKYNLISVGLTRSEVDYSVCNRARTFGRGTVRRKKNVSFGLVRLS